MCERVKEKRMKQKVGRRTRKYNEKKMGRKMKKGGKIKRKEKLKKKEKKKKEGKFF